MTLVCGIDPGNNGAVAVYDTELRKLVSVEDFPTWMETINTKKRERFDEVGLMEQFDVLQMMGIELAVLEAVGGRPRQSASGAFVFGYTVGFIRGCIMHRKIPIETVPASFWKKAMRVPGKAGGKGNDDRKKATADIMKRVNELFPDQQEMFKTPRGAYRMDRADAAMLAKFAGDHVLHSITAPQKNVTDRIAYRKNPRKK